MPAPLDKGQSPRRERRRRSRGATDGSDAMTTRYLGAPIARNEDRRLLTGRALFVNDVERPGMLHVAFLRSPNAHARLGAVDLSRVRKRPGVVAAYAADDLGDYWKPGPLLVAAAHRGHGFQRANPSAAGAR